MAIVGCTSFDGTVIPSAQDELAARFAPSIYTAPNGVSMAVRTFMPSVAVPRKVPLVVYLHGSGQNGADNLRQLDDSVGCLYSFSANREDYKAVIVAPQCPNGVYWRDESMLEALKSLIEASASAETVDQDRIFVTGFSMGGDAAWKLGLSCPQLMSTLVPVCGGPMASMEPDVPEVPDEMASLNIWAFNSFDDQVVRPDYSKRIFSRLWALDDGDYLNFTESVGGGHSPRSVYSNRNLLIWMFSTRRRSRRSERQSN